MDKLINDVIEATAKRLVKDAPVVPFADVGEAFESFARGLNLLGFVAEVPSAFPAEAPNAGG